MMMRSACWVFGSHFLQEDRWREIMPRLEQWLQERRHSFGSDQSPPEHTCGCDQSPPAASLLGLCD